MKQILFLTIIFALLTTTNLSGQDRERIAGIMVFGKDTLFIKERITDTVVSLAKEIDETKTVVLLKNRNFIVKISLSDFKNHMDNRYIENPQYWDKRLLEKVLKKAEKSNTINVSKLANNRDLKERLDFRIASLLQKGQCLILNRKTNEVVLEIRLQWYSSFNGALGGKGGRRFYINDILILETVDLIS